MDNDMGVTANAVLLLGYIAGAIALAGADDGPLYEVVSIDAPEGAQLLRHRETGNVYRMTILQVEGVE